MIEHYRKIQRQRAAGEISDKGFTLIELLVVIVVLGILAAVVVFALGGVTGKSATAACNADAKSVEVAVEAYKAENGSTPAAQTDNTGPLTQSANGGPFLRTWPSNASHYAIATNAAGHVLVTPTGGTQGDYDTTNGAICNNLP